MVMPPGLRAREQRSGKVYFYLDTGSKPRKEIPLGESYQLAMQKWAQLIAPAQEAMPTAIRFTWLAEQYVKRVVPTKAPQTQRDNIRELKSLINFFTSGGDAPIHEIRPHHISRFLEWRGAQAPVRANREKALLSHMFNWARSNGYLDLANPCDGIKAHRETGRDFYVTDELLTQLLKHCDQPTVFALRLLYLSGQRRGDVLAMRLSQIHGDYLHVTQNKTGASIRIALINEKGKSNSLGELINEILGFRKNAGATHEQLLVTESGQPISEDTLRSRFDSSREECANKLQQSGRRDLAKEARKMQMRDLRAKAATDVESATGSAREAQKLLAHAQQNMTEHYIRKRQGMIVNPTK